MRRFVILAVCFAVLVAAAVPASALTLTFNSFCDGMTFVQKATGLNGDKVWAGVRTGCGSGPTVGAKNVNATGLIRYDMTISVSAPYLYVIRGNRTWTNYNSAGLKINTGTWRLGLPAPGAAAFPDSAQ